MFVRLLFSLFLLMMLVVAAGAQTTGFNYQGRLTDSSLPAGGTYQMEFKLYDALSGGTQIGSTITNNSVTVVNGVFTVTLDFGSSPFAAADRWMAISVKKPAEGAFTLLTPRQQITSSPYSIKTLTATSADGLSTFCNGCIDSAKIANGTIVDADVSNTAAIAGSKISGNIAGNAANVTGTVALSNGGTGATTAAGARSNLGLGTLATQSPTGTADSTTFLRGDNTWGPAGGSALRVFDANNNLLGFVQSVNLRTVTIMNSAGYVFSIFLSGQLVPNQFYWSSASCTGTPYLNDGSSTGGRWRYYKQLVFSIDSNSLYTSASPNANGESTSAVQTVLSFRNTSSTVQSGSSSTCDPSGNTGGWAVTAITPAAAGITVVAGSNPMRVSTPLVFQ